MKALPPPPSQLELLSQSQSLIVVEPETRREVLRTLAEILLAAVDAAATMEVHDEAR